MTLRLWRALEKKMLINKVNNHQSDSTARPISTITYLPMIQWTITSFLGHQKVEAANPSQRASLSWYQCVAVARHCLPSCHPCFAQRPTSRRREAPWWGHSHSIPKPRRPQHWCGISTIQKKIPRVYHNSQKSFEDSRKFCRLVYVI